jgi:Prokaryotic metallothionein
MSPTVKCAHAACKCEVPQVRLDQNAKHCSDSCAVETTDETGCGCGHAACDIELAAHPGGDESVISVGPEGSGS